MPPSPPSSPDAAPILIQGGRVIDPANGRDEVADVLLEDGTLKEIGSCLNAPAGAREIDAAGLIVAPGLVDPHVHLREPGMERAETIETGTAAAVAGGFTTVCCMPNTVPALDTPERVRHVIERAEATGQCRVFVVAAATVGREGKEPTDVEGLVKAGAVAISDDGDWVESSDVMRAVMQRCADAGVAVVQHCQVQAMTGGSVMHEGALSTRLGLRGWPRDAEECAIERDIDLVRETGCRYHAQHLSSGGSVRLIRRARTDGLPVSAEASPHHLLLTQDELTRDAVDGHPGYFQNAKMNPPLRESSDVEALRLGVAEGAVTVLATDHAPHPPEAKARPLEEAPFGIIGLETALACYAEALVSTGLITWNRLIGLMTYQGADLCSLAGHGIGRLGIGGPPDVTLIDPELAWTITESDLAGKSANTPFLGRSVKGRAVMTIVAGRVASELSPAQA